MSAGLRRYHGAMWDEPIIMEMGATGRRALRFGPVEDGVRDAVGGLERLIPRGARRKTAPALPELSEPEVLRHYLHLSQQTLGMMGISLFGTCTMKYNSRMAEAVTGSPKLADVHPAQAQETLQGTLEIIHRLDSILRELSGMDRFVFQAGGGAAAAYVHACVARAWFASKGELGTRTEMITSIQTHPCNAATAATAGFRTITLPLGPNGYPTLESLRATVSERTAGLMINNPDDMGIYNPEITEWIRIVHAAGGLCFYDHANFNGVMSKVRARELGFDACMYMLHKTFGAPKGGGGPAVGAYGCREELAPFLPSPCVVLEENEYRLQTPEHSLGKIREFMGNVPVIVKAYAWARAMGAEGICEASDISVLINNYMERKLLEIRGITRSHPNVDGWRMEMTRYSLGQLYEETGVTAADVQQRMVDFGVDAFWMAHEPWEFPQPFTPEAGEMWSKEDVDYWIAVLKQISDEAYSNPEIVKTAPHNQPIHRVCIDHLEDPNRWAMTWRAYQRKRAENG
jgi:glycine dehydrogenase subunit 2